MFQLDPPSDVVPRNIVDEGNSYSISFKAYSTSGAELPINCMVYVEEDTGFVSDYTQTAIPVSISTVPNITQSQAIQIGRDWIYENISTDAATGELMTEENYPGVIRFKVEVDELLNQALVYEIAYKRIPLVIDAHTGAVIHTDEWQSVGNACKSGPRRNKRAIERFKSVYLRSDSLLPVDHSAIETQGQTYVWVRYAKLCGIRHGKQGGKLVMERNGKRLILNINGMATGLPNTAWLNKERLYVPISTLQKLGAGIDGKSDSKVVLNVPKTKPALSH